MSDPVPYSQQKDAFTQLQEKSDRLIKILLDTANGTGREQEATEAIEQFKSSLTIAKNSLNPENLV